MGQNALVESGAGSDVLAEVGEGERVGGGQGVRIKYRPEDLTKMPVNSSEMIHIGIISLP